jgi:hypothetical protein
MATTTNYGWTTPDNTALVKDGASAIRTLGSSVDTTVKALSPGTTAGDVDYYTSSTAKARLGIGTTGQVLTVAAGVPSWASPSSGAYTLLSTTSLSGTATTISSISQAYKHLFMVIYGVNVGSNSNITLRPNGVNTNWYWAGVRSGVETSSNSNINLYTGTLGASQSSNTASVHLYNYSSAVANKSFVNSAFFYSVSNGAFAGFSSGGSSNSATAITSLEINTGASATGTVLLYGVN